MSSAVCHRQPIDDLLEDVLAEIFSYIDGDDLLDWQIVCRRWHRVINTLTNWKIVLERKLRSSVTWRQVEKRLDHSAPETRSDYRLLYRNIRRKIQELDHSWRSGKFSELDIEVDGERSCGADDDFLVNFKDEDLVVYDRRQLEIQFKPTGRYWFYHSHFAEGVLFVQRKQHRHFCIIDAETGNELGKIEDFFDVSQVSVSSALMALVVSSHRYPTVQLWGKTSDGVELLQETEYKADPYTFGLRTELDDQNLVVFAKDALRRGLGRKRVNIYIFHHLKKTSRTMAVQCGGRGTSTAFHYGQGILFLIRRPGNIQLMEASTGQSLRTIRHQRWNFFRDATSEIAWTPMALNSKFMATMDNDSMDSTINVYDLVAAKDPGTDSGGFLLVSIQVPGFVFCRLQMNETEIYGIGRNKRSRMRNESFKTLNFLETGTSHEVVGNITQRGVVRKPSLNGQAKLCN